MVKKQKTNQTRVAKERNNKIRRGRRSQKKGRKRNKAGRAATHSRIPLKDEKHKGEKGGGKREETEGGPMASTRGGG